jgi:hypothetical protein
MAIKTPWRLVMEEILDDNEWHPLAELLAASYDLVPNKLALRLKNRGIQNGSTRLQERDLRLAKGKFTYAKISALRTVKSGTWEMSGDFVRRRQGPPPPKVFRRTYPRTPWTKAMAEYLADGEWHPVRDVIAVGAELVPPVRALREVSQDRRYRERAHGINYYDPGAPGVRDSSIQQGKWSTAYEALHESVARGQFYEQSGDMVRRIDVATSTE